MSQGLERIKDSTRAINKEIKKVSEGTAEYAKLKTELAENALKAKELKAQQQALNKEFKEAKNAVPKDSLAGLRLEYAKLTEQITKLSAAERGSDFGKALISRASKIKQEINGIEESVGRFTGSVGNYKKGALAIGDIITGGLATGGIVAAVQAVTQVMAVGFDQARQYEQALDDLSALTGLTGDALKSVENVADGLREIQIGGEAVINTGPDILNALKLVGGAQPELLKNAKALGAVTKEAIILSRASGDGLEPSVKALTTVLGQFKEPASEAGRIINELAAGAKEGASEIPDTTDALQKFGTTAKNSNVTTAESIALIETLADRQLKGAEAGTQLRNILSKLAAADVLPKSAQAEFARLNIDLNILKDSSLPLEVRLRELGKAQGDVTALTKAFGVENLSAAQILTDGIDKYVQLNAAITGTNEAYQQAEIRAGNTNTVMENLKNKGLNLLEKAFTALDKPIRLVIGSLGLLFDAVNIVLNPIDSLFSALDYVAEKVGLIDPPTDKLVSLETGLNALIGPINDVSKGNLVMARTAEQTAAQLAKQGKVARLLGEDMEQPVKTIGALTREVKDLKNKLLSVEEGTPAWEELSAQLKAANDELKRMKSSAGFTKPMREEAKAAKGSIGELRAQISDLKKDIENAPPNQIAAKIEELAKKEAALKKLEDRLSGIRNKLRLSNTPIPSVVTDESIPTDSAADILALDKDINEKRAKEQERANKERLKREREIAETEIEENRKVGREKARQIEEDTRREIELERDKQKQIRDAAFEVAAGTADGIFDLAAQRTERQKQDAITKTEEEYARRIEAAQGNAALIEQLEKEKAAKLEAIEKDAARKRKQQAIIESLVNTALAVTRALATSNIVGAIAAGALGAVQTAFIAAQPLAKGGQVGDGMETYPAGFFQSLPDYSRGGYTGTGTNRIDGTGRRVAGRLGGRAALHAQEYVVNARQVREFPQIIRFLEANRVQKPAYASGGAVYAGVPNFVASQAYREQRAAQGGGTTVVQAGLTDEQMRAFAAINAAAVEAAVQRGIAIGQEDAHRRNEREGYLNEARRV